MTVEFWSSYNGYPRIRLIILTLHLLMLNLHTSSAGLERSCQPSDYGAPTGRCGKDLYIIIEMVCEGSYYQSSVKKRAKRRLTHREPVHTKDPNFGAFLDAATARSFMLKLPSKRYVYDHVITPSTRFGIVCECCVNNCDILELQQYCA